MAKIKKIIRSNPVSVMSQVAPQGGAAIWAGLSDALDSAYKAFLPGAIDEMQRAGTEEGFNAARNTIGSPATANAASGGSSGNAQYAYRRLQEMGVPKTAAAGIVGNLMQESGPNLNTTASGDSGASFGIAQWMGPRKRAFFDYAAREGKDPNSIDTQLEYLVYEGVTTEKSAWQKILGASTPEEAALVGAEKFWRPGIPNNERRQAFARSVFDGGTVASDRPATVSVMTDQGKIEPRLYSPYSGPILRAHDAAAEVAYNAEVANQAAAGLLDISQNYLLDPEGFKQAADSYIKKITDDAPSRFRPGLRASLTTMADRRYLGVLEAKQADIRRRAANASSAMTTRLQKEYAGLLASGDAEGALAVSMELQQVLKTRERLPGVSWTPEQSQNVMSDAMDMADAMKARNLADAQRELKDNFSTAIDAARNGMVAADEGYLVGDEAAAILPEKAAELRAYANLRDNMPEFLKLPPQDQKAIIQQMRNAPVENGWDADIVKAAESAARDNAKAWRDDPIKRAAEVLGNKPPSIDGVSPTDQAFIDTLQARRKYGLTLLENGYTDQKVFFSKDEAAAISQLFDKSVDPAIRASTAAAIVAGFGPDAIPVFNQLDIDTTTRMAGMMMAVGGDPSIATKALVGEQLISEGVVAKPKAATLREAFNATVGDAFQGIPDAPQRMGDILDFAQAIYAADAQGADEANSDDLIQSAIQKALGQSTNTRGETTGGVQEILGHKTLLPIGVSGEESDTAIREALGFSVGGAAIDTLPTIDFMGKSSGVALDEGAWWSAIYGDSALPTGQKDAEGHPIYQTSDGTVFGAKPVTVEGPDGKFYNVPTVFNGNQVSAKEAAQMAFANGQAYDPIIRKPLTGYSSEEEAAKNIPSLPDGPYPVAPTVPMLNGKPIDPTTISEDNIRIVHVAGNKYRMEIVLGDSAFDAQDAYGNVMLFDLPKLVESFQ